MLNTAQTSHHEVNAGILMERYIENGHYKHLKRLEQEKDILHKTIYQHLINSEIKRHEIGHHLVAKFIAKQVYQYDYVGLNEYLYHHGLLQRLTRLTSPDISKMESVKEMFAPYRQQTGFYVKPSFNKEGKQWIQVGKPFEQSLSLEEAAQYKSRNLRLLRVAEQEYAELKRQLEKCEQLILTGKVQHKFGSVSRVPKPAIYRTDHMTEPEVINGLIKYGKPTIGEVIKYVLRGFLSKSELESFRRLIDIKLEMVILDLDDEAKILKRPIYM